MNILGVGIPELFFVILIALVVLGPKDMQKTGKMIGGFMQKVVMSPEWRTVKDVSRQVKTLPNQWMREANLEVQGIGDNFNIDKKLFNGNPASNPGRSEVAASEKNISRKEGGISENTQEESSAEDKNG